MDILSNAIQIIATASAAFFPVWWMYQFQKTLERGKQKSELCVWLLEIEEAANKSRSNTGEIHHIVNKVTDFRMALPRFTTLTEQEADQLQAVIFNDVRWEQPGSSAAVMNLRNSLSPVRRSQ